MTEIPEHLLKRSKERRSAMGGEAAEESTGSAPAKAAAAPAAVPARAEAPKPVIAPPKVDPPYVRAAKERRKIPFWAMLPLSLLPLWAWMYVRSVQDHPVKVEGPVAIGQELYGKCAGCHGAAGGGGAGRQLSNAEVLKTFPAVEDQLRWMLFGTEKYKAAGIAVYGNPNREGGAHNTGSYGVMPGWQGELSDAEILAVTCYVRFDLSGADSTAEPWAAEFEKWCSAESPEYAALREGMTYADPEFAAVGNAPKAGGDKALAMGD
ncbi:MAG: c-type cytochrome [Actinobacteria bacterium]|nr:c-type cytochrome [Actinomycetota bacterium]MSX79855.1 c-type cytochrome [Actinomycetota bacterium]